MTRFLNALTLFAAAMLLAHSVGSAKAADEKIRVLVITGFDFPSHVWEESARLNAAILEESGRFDVEISSDKEVMAQLPGSDFDVVILNFGFWNEAEPSDEAKSGLLKFAEQGGGVVALHFACASFQEWDGFHDLLGRVWVKGTGGHGPYGPFTVDVVNHEHPITAGLESFQTEDELYARLDGEGEIEVLATADSDWSGATEPLVFVKRYGEGRVVHNLLGHGLDAKRVPAYQTLLIRGTEWAATGAVASED